MHARTMQKLQHGLGWAGVYLLKGINKGLIENLIENNSKTSGPLQFALDTPHPLICNLIN